MTDFLHDLTPASIHVGPFPLAQLLENSLYYPSSHFDGAVVKAYAYDFASFVYCDYGATDADGLAQLQTFRGYDVLADRPVRVAELIPNGWSFEMTRHLLAGYGNYPDFGKLSFAHWAVYERKPEYTDMHGPTRFSLLYIGGEGVATYQALYWSNRTTAKAVAIVQPGTGFGCNWTDFMDGHKALGYVVSQNPCGQPDFIANDAAGLLRWESHPHATHKISCRYSREHIRSFYEYSRADDPVIPPRSPFRTPFHSPSPATRRRLQISQSRWLAQHSRGR